MKKIINLFKIFIFWSTGAGYVLSNESLSRIGSKLSTDFKFCPNSGKLLKQKEKLLF